MISFEKMLPMTMIVLSVLASVVYLYHKDYKHAVYWMAGAVLNITVVLMK